MKIETLHKRLKQKYKKSVSEIEHITNGHFYPPSKRFHITKNDLVLYLEQYERDEYFRCTVYDEMKGPKVIDLINLIM